MTHAPGHLSKTSDATPPVLFYDGGCGLCTGSVRWFLGRDRHARLMFAPLQGSTYEGIRDAAKPTGLDTIVFLDSSGLHQRSTAVLRAMLALGGLWSILGWAGLLVPRPIRDAVYCFIANRRVAWFGVADACALPTPEQAARFMP
ncbi:MAG: DUF393 domain-containing protein [Phycisphaerae bacterium]|nr:DUF393 domain-containing protein [Phycisphaerae bacterium]